MIKPNIEALKNAKCMEVDLQYSFQDLVEFFGKSYEKNDEYKEKGARVLKYFNSIQGYVNSIVEDLEKSIE